MPLFLPRSGAFRSRLRFSLPSFRRRWREHLLGGDLGVEGHVEHAHHHLVETLLAPGHRLGGVGVLPVVRRVVEVLGALDLRVLGQLQGLSEVVPKLPAPVGFRHVQQGLGLAVGEDDAVLRGFAARVHVRMQAEQRHVFGQCVGCIHAEVRVAGRDLERLIDGRERHGALDGRLLGNHEAQQPPVERPMTLSAVNQSFKIPPGDPNFRVDAAYTLPEDVTLLGLHPHMHTRGKSAQYRVVFADGKTETLLDVPKYNWRWQLWYDLAQPLKLPKDTKIECTEHFDNSPNNRENPDSTKTVTWGQQSFDEMMVCMFNVAFDAKITTKQMLAPPPPKRGQREAKPTAEGAAPR